MAGWPWPAPADDGATAHLVPGCALPDVTLEATVGAPVALTRQKGRAVVFVYPWTGRPGVDNPPGWDDIAGAHGSTPQAEGFRDWHAAYQSLGIDVFGLSGQAPDWQRELAGRLGLPFALLSDHDLAFARVLGLPTFETGGVAYLRRLTLVIADGRVERIVYPVHPPDSHAGDLIASLLAGAGRS